VPWLPGIHLFAGAAPGGRGGGGGGRGVEGKRRERSGEKRF